MITLRYTERGLYHIGDKVMFYRGYNDNLKLRFVGYIEDISGDKSQFRITAYDKLYTMLKEQVKVSEFIDKTNKEIIEAVFTYSEVDFQAPIVKFPNNNNIT
jgi:hypothetical protein